jgi:uncharacterized membrane protein YgcG
MEAQKSGSQPPPSPITWSAERKLFFLQAVLGVVTLMAAIAFTLIAYIPTPANANDPSSNAYNSNTAITWQPLARIILTALLLVGGGGLGVLMLPLRHPNMEDLSLEPNTNDDDIIINAVLGSVNAEKTISARTSPREALKELLPNLSMKEIDRILQVMDAQVGPRERRITELRRLLKEAMERKETSSVTLIGDATNGAFIPAGGAFIPAGVVGRFFGNCNGNGNGNGNGIGNGIKSDNNIPNKHKVEERKPAEVQQRPQQQPQPQQVQWTTRQEEEKKKRGQTHPPPQPPPPPPPPPAPTGRKCAFGDRCRNLGECKYIHDKTKKADGEGNSGTNVRAANGGGGGDAGGGGGGGGDSDAPRSPPPFFRLAPHTNIYQAAANQPSDVFLNRIWDIVTPASHQYPEVGSYTTFNPSGTGLWCTILALLFTSGVQTTYNARKSLTQCLADTAHFLMTNYGTMKKNAEGATTWSTTKETEARFNQLTENLGFTEPRFTFTELVNTEKELRAGVTENKSTMHDPNIMLFLYNFMLSGIPIKSSIFQMDGDHNVINQEGVTQPVFTTSAYLNVPESPPPLRLTLVFVGGRLKPGGNVRDTNIGHTYAVGVDPLDSSTDHTIAIIDRLNQLTSKTPGSITLEDVWALYKSATATSENGTLEKEGVEIVETGTEGTDAEAHKAEQAKLDGPQGNAEPEDETSEDEAEPEGGNDPGKKEAPPTATAGVLTRRAKGLTLSWKLPAKGNGREKSGATAPAKKGAAAPAKKGAAAPVKKGATTQSRS